MEACQFLALSLMAVVLVRGSKMAHLIAACSPAGLTSRRAGHEYKPDTGRRYSRGGSRNLRRGVLFKRVRARSAPKI